MKDRTRYAALIAVAIVTIFLAGCTAYEQAPGPGIPQPAQPSVSGGTEVMIENFAFAPPIVTVQKGTTVTWTNLDSVNHQVASDPGSPVSFSSDPLPKGATYQFTFVTPGTYPYHCTIHPSMKATVEVT